nr:papain-like protease II [Grapevine rootstock stem lesion associated virus]
GDEVIHSTLASTVVLKPGERARDRPKSISFGSFCCELRYVESVNPDAPRLRSEKVLRKVEPRNGVRTESADVGSNVTRKRDARIDRKFSHLLAGSVNKVKKRIAAGVLRYRVGGDMDFHNSFLTQAGYHLLVRRKTSSSVCVELSTPDGRLLRRDVIPCSRDYAAMLSFAAGGRFPLVLMTRDKYKNGYCYLAHCRYASAFLLKGFHPAVFDIGANPTAAKLRSRMVSVLGDRSLSLNLYGSFTSRGIFHCDYDAAYVKDLRFMSAIVAG